MTTLLTVIHIIACILLVIMVLIQSGKGAEISASFGGSSQTVFGSSGGANFFVKVTGALAAIFFCTSLALTVLGGQAKKSLFDNSLIPTQAPAQSAPAQTAPAAPAQNTAQNAPAQGTAPAAPAQTSAPAQH